MSEEGSAELEELFIGKEVDIGVDDKAALPCATGSSSLSSSSPFAMAFAMFSSVGGTTSIDIGLVASSAAVSSGMSCTGCTTSAGITGFGRSDMMAAMSCDAWWAASGAVSAAAAGIGSEGGCSDGVADAGAISMAGAAAAAGSNMITSPGSVSSDVGISADEVRSCSCDVAGAGAGAGGMDCSSVFSIDSALRSMST